MGVEIFASKNVEKTLKNVRKEGGTAKLAAENLARDLAEGSGRVEPKGAGMYGIDLPGGYRTFFCFNQKQEPVLVFFGNHAEYDRLTSDAKTRLKESADAPVKTTLSSRHVEKDVPLERYVQTMREAGPLSSGKVHVARDAADASPLKENFGRETGRAGKKPHGFLAPSSKKTKHGRPSASP